MVASTGQLDHLEKLAAQLSPREQLELLVRIGQHLGVVLEQPPREMVGSAAGILRAASEPPHLDDEAVKELETAIAAGRKPVRTVGEFDNGAGR